MARRIKDSALDFAPGAGETQTARRTVLPVGRERRSPWLSPPRGSAGTWLVRRFNGTAYRADRLGIADDLSDADGVTVLDYWQAVDPVRKRLAEQGRAATESVRRLTVTDAMDRYIRSARKRRPIHAFGQRRSLSQPRIDQTRALAKSRCQRIDHGSIAQLAR